MSLLAELKLSFTKSTSSAKFILTMTFILPTVLMHLTVLARYKLSYNYNNTILRHTSMHTSSMVHPPVCGTTSILLPLISSLLLRGSNRVTPLPPSFTVFRPTSSPLALVSLYSTTALSLVLTRLLLLPSAILISMVLALVIASTLLKGAYSTDALQHRQTFLDLGFLSSVLLLHPSNTNDPNMATSYGFKLFGSYVGSDEFILNSLDAYLLELHQQANRLSLKFLLIITSIFWLTKPSHLLSTIPPHLAQQVNVLCVTVFCSMLSNQHPGLSPLHSHQLHLHVDDGGFSLPDMLLVRDCGYSASFAQCVPDILGFLSLLQPISIHDISLS